jgi:hypothetical protein
MSNHPGGRRSTRPPSPRRARAAAGITGVAATALLAVACGDSPPSPHAGGAPTAGAPASWVAFSRCLRSHGVPNFPDPDGSGQLPPDAKSALRQVSDSVAKAATSACQNLNPAKNPPAPLTAQQEQDYLRAAACMRSHGITNFPDPTFPGGRVSTRIPATIDTGSPQVIQARQVCERLIPAGLRSSGG